MRIVFIGDSITASGRFEDSEGIGIGYVRLIRDFLRVTYPEQKWEVINKGINGNKVTDLADRWQQDVIQLDPDVVSVSIGINEAWSQLEKPWIDQIYPDEFAKVYDKLVYQIQKDTNANIVLMEPTVIGEKYDSTGNEILKEYVNIVNNMAAKNNTVMVPTHQSFLQYLQIDNKYPLTTDSVHMNSMGNMLMAFTWIGETKALFAV